MSAPAFVQVETSRDCGQQQQHPSPSEHPYASEYSCKVIIRSRLARTAWEKLCRAVVGNPVHMDVVLHKPGSPSARFCFSSYVNQMFEMCLMDEAQIMDPAMINQCMDITEEDYNRCMKFLLGLVEGRAKYDYMDALLLMPMAPKGIKRAAWFASTFKDILQDVEVDETDKTILTARSSTRVFCSQSVALMLRECLDPEGIHAPLVEKLKHLNSRLVSPKMVFECIHEDPFAVIISNKELRKLAMSSSGDGA